MPKFRKKPVVVDAYPIPIESRDGEDAFMIGHGCIAGWFMSHGFWDYKVADDMGYDLDTLEGTLHAEPGDWIIRGVNGEFYSCKPDVFEKTYEPV